MSWISKNVNKVSDSIGFNPWRPDQAMKDLVTGVWDDFTGKSGVEAANAASLQASREQMAFQERMSSTAHQREVEDLRKAGLNPILSAGGSGASAPSGAQPTVHAWGGTKEAIVSLLNMVTGMMQTNASVANMGADTGKKIAETPTPGQTQRLIEKQIETTGASARNISAQAKSTELDNVKKEVVKNIYEGVKGAQETQRNLYKKLVDGIRKMFSGGSSSVMEGRYNITGDMPNY